MRKAKREEARVFLLSFSVAFLCLSMAYLGFMTFAHPDNGSSAAARSEPEEAYAPEPEDALTVLFMGASGRDAVPEVFLLARFDPAGRAVPVAAFPGAMAVDNNGRREPLSEVYRYGGAAYTTDTLAAALDIPIHRYAKIGHPDFLTAADAVGAVEFQLAEERKLRIGGADIVLGAGRQLLDGQKAAALIASAGGQGSDPLGQVSALAAAIVNQRMDVALSTVVDNIFEKIINLVESDISYPDYHNRKEAAMWLAEQGGEPAFAVPVQGAWDEEGRMFVLSDTGLARLASAFG